MSDQTPYERTVVEEPAVVRREEVRVREGGNAGWWIAALVAVVAVVALMFAFTGNRPSEADLQAARDTGRAEAMLDNASRQAQLAAESASQASREAADRAASVTESAAAQAQAAADRAAANTEAAAANVGEAAEDAAATVDPDAPQ